MRLTFDLNCSNSFALSSVTNVTNVTNVTIATNVVA